MKKNFKKILWVKLPQNAILTLFRWGYFFEKKIPWWGVGPCLVRPKSVSRVISKEVRKEKSKGFIKEGRSYEVKRVL